MFEVFVGRKDRVCFTSMDFETFLVVRADWTLLAVASTLADILR